MKKNKLNIETIEYRLNGIRFKESNFLSDSQKFDMLNSVFSSIESHKVQKTKKSFISPFMSHSMFRVAVSVFTFCFLYIGIISYKNTHYSNNTDDINDTENTSLNSIYQTSSNTSDTESVHKRTKDVKKQVAALVSQNKITEAKNIVLGLENILLKELNTDINKDKEDKNINSIDSATSTAEKEITKETTKAAIIETTELRIELEKKEINAVYENINNRIETAKKTLKDIENSDAFKKIEKTDLKNDSKIDLKKDNIKNNIIENIKSAKEYLEKAISYIEKKDIENATITLQNYDRLLAEIQVSLII